MKSLNDPAEGVSKIELARLHHQAGQLPDAEQLYREILTEKPSHADALHGLGTLVGQLGHFDTAIWLIGQAIRFGGDSATYHHNLGALYLNAGRLDEALASYGRAAALKPDDAEVHYRLGTLHTRQGHVMEAAQCYRRAIALRPDYAEAYNNLGNALWKLNQVGEAVTACRQAIALRPDFAEAYNNLGNAMRTQGHGEEAIACYRHAAALKPEFMEAHNNLGNALREAGRLEDAMQACEKALAIDPDFADALNNLGNVLKDMDRLDDAAGCYKRALDVQPGDAEAWSNLGAVYMAKEEATEALACYDRAITLKPEYVQAHCNKAFALLQTGNFGRGWPEHEWRLRLQKVQPQFLRAPQWDGGDLQGRTILLHEEQGFGDAIQFVRYVAAVKRRGGRVILFCSPPLASLFETLEGADQVIANADRLPPYDVQASLMSLPALMGDTGITPVEFPYLHSPAALQEDWRRRIAHLSGPRIGIAWRGNPAHNNDRNRSLTAELFSRFFNSSDSSLVIVQKDADATELATLEAAHSILNAGPDLKDFNDTAALLSTLDLLITVDTSVCHLAGALGMPVWTLLPFSPDWRWKLKRTDSPWYPSMRLFRQATPKDWQAVIEQVQQELRELADRRYLKW